MVDLVEAHNLFLACLQPLISWMAIANQAHNLLVTLNDICDGPY